VALLLEPFSDAKLVLGGAEKAGNLADRKVRGQLRVSPNLISSTVGNLVFMAGWGLGVEGQLGQEVGLQ
jgi:hypothetical protein